MRPPTLALLLAGLGSAVAQELPLRFGPWDPASYGRHGESLPASPSFEVSALRGHVPGLEGRAATEMVGVNYRLWMRHGRADVGIGFGPLGYVVQAPDHSRTVIGAVPTITLGLRYRVSEEHLLFADATGARRLAGEPDGAYVATKIGVEWQPAKSSLGLAHGALGLQLDSGYRLMVKVRHGKPALYLRTQF